MKKSDRIREMLGRGCKYSEIMREADCAASTIAYHAKIMGKQQNTFERKTYDWSAIQEYYDEGNTIADVIDHFGVDRSSVRSAKARGDFITIADHDPDRNAKRQKRYKERRKEAQSDRFSPEKVFRIDNGCSLSVVKRLLRECDAIPYLCSIELCPLNKTGQWVGRQIVFHLDHINGRTTDNRITNLRWLCPNCHSQTDTYCGRNNKKS